ncbi:sensor histidine kinase [Paenibacillus piri]|uniref:HAMP domain-containing protein n=1 Tax=Paenibacillus piri TaxID=2547395 RepID=A0A4R5KR22_9BACL|nr:histidine kinase [Paenibacillus piri]TDF98036.1 HAMP domain-containing protein [Paenibacillus piri]
MPVLLKSMRIKTKITAVAFISILLSVGLSGFSIYLYVNPILSKQIVRDNQAIVAKIAQQISYQIEDAVNYARGIVVNDQLQLLLKKMSTIEGYDYYVNNLQLETMLKEYSLLRDNIIVDMIIVDNNNKVLEMNDVYSSSISEDWYDDFRASPMYNGFSKKHIVTNNVNTLSRIMVITYVMNIYDKQTPNVYLGKLLIHMNYDVLVKPMLTDPVLGIRIQTMDKNERIVYAPDQPFRVSPDEALVSMLFPEKSVLRDGQYYFIESIPLSEWKVMGILSENKINANMKYTNYVLLSIMVICLLMMSVFIYPVVSNVTKPLMKLIRGMRQVSKGELTTNLIVTSGDEIEEVAKVFNKMVRDIKDLVDESVLMEKKKRELELQMFMYQINPHFIYNTLNSVIYLARKANAPDIATLTKAFISFLQRTIKNKPEMLSSISEEMIYIEDYAKILQYRYNGRMELEWHVDADCREKKIPRMILYPLVENSIYHGILPSQRPGWIRIGVTSADNLLTVSVEDNGVGMAAGKLEKLRSLMNSPFLQEDLDHIGMLNVNNRLKLMFDEAAILHIESVENNGTRIRFSIPDSLPDDADHKIV